MKRNSLAVIIFALLASLLIQPADAQWINADTTHSTPLFETADEQPGMQVQPVGHFFHGGQDAACCDTGCDDGCASTPCDAMIPCECGPGKPMCECCKCRKTLLGDLMGARTCLAEHGVSYRASLTQFYQGVTSGGAQETFRYGGKLDQYFDVSTEKMGLWKGGLLEVHAPTLYGQNSILDAAALAPANTAFLIPRPFDLPVISITNFSYTQEIGHGFAATAGKYDFLELWAKFLPDYGKGVDGFMNTSSLIFLNVVPTLPTVFNGAGLLKAGEKGLEAGVFAIDLNTTATVSGISELWDNGTSVLGFYRVYSEFCGLPGSHLAAGVYSNRVYTNYDRNGWTFHPEEGVQAGQKAGSWLGAYVGEQTLWQDRCDKNRKIWFLTTMGWADRKTSPYQFAGTYSLEAKGWNPNRKGDRMGIAYFYSDVSDDLENLVPGIVGLEDVQGGEFYYNAEINPWFHVTGDVQVIDTEIASQDTAVLLGVRAKIDL